MHPSNQCPSSDYPLACLRAEPRGARLWLVCRIGDRFYGIDMQCVQEVCGYEKPCGVAGSAEYLAGRLRRGQVIFPVVDLRIRLGLSNLSTGRSTAIVVVKVDRDVVGFIVDDASEAIELPATRASSCVQRAACAMPFTKGMDSQGDTALAFLDMDLLLEDAVGLDAQAHKSLASGDMSIRRATCPEGVERQAAGCVNAEERLAAHRELVQPLWDELHVDCTSQRGRVPDGGATARALETTARTAGSR